MNQISKVREKLFFDISIIGAGLAGLSTGIRLKQLDPKLEICILEKSFSVGDHVLSGCVFNPRALYELLPNWENMDSPIKTKVSSVENLFLTSKSYYSIPSLFTPWSSYNGHYIISLSECCRWLKSVALSMNIRIFEGFCAKELMVHQTGYIEGVITGPIGLTKALEKSSGFQDSLEILASQTIFAEGTHGHLTEKLINLYKLNEYTNIEHEIHTQTYSLGFKEVWKVPSQAQGKVINTYYWPLKNARSKGFIYSSNDHLHIGLLIGLDYINPHIHLYKEFQKFKSHPFVYNILRGGECLEFGAKVLDDGGLFCVPKLSFSGGMIVGSAGGLTNPMTMQGAHIAVKSGVIAAEAIADQMKTGSIVGKDIVKYYENYRKSWVYEELYRYRNIRQTFNHSPLVGLVYSAYTRNYLDRPNFLIQVNRKGDNLPPSDVTGLSKNHKIIEYPVNDGKVSFDIETSLEKTRNIWKNQPEYISLHKGGESTARYSLEDFSGLEEKICPTGVFKYTDSKLYISSQKCIQCGSCKIKSVKKMINWVPPEAGTGPQ